ncbi:TonB-dependent receptor domain-containing protein [Parasediminibacterium paludis]|uniref:TonB-dependent receptor domain-containing protein n=1 Tax=Parasediminibacterium paludis TaxID=908966 RepID=A0ABV8Q0G6_9BACT
MHKTKQLLLIAIVIVCSIGQLLAQSTINGKVTDSKGAPIENATVTSLSSKAKAITNKDGIFTISAVQNQSIEISSIGYKTKTVVVKGASVNIVLEAAAVNLEEVVLVGSRKGGRVKTESPVPVDVININQAGVPTAKMDLTSVLNYAAPSFNYNKQSGADGADHVDLGTLRGLGPDQTLVLINGKRRHQTAFVALFGTRGRGNSGVDLNAFPQAAVDRIEILRDGASAQYGSDAMAGVINLILKKNTNQWSINTGYSGYYDSKFNAQNFNQTNQYYAGNKLDGGTFSFSANNGVNIGKNGGFINVSVDFLNQGKTFREVGTDNWQTNSYALPSPNTGRRAFGDGSVTTVGVMYNMEIPTSASKKTTFYSFGGYNYKASDAYAYTRNWSARPDRFPVNASGALIFDPNIMKVATGNGLVDTFYNPHIQTHIKDVSLAAGLKGDAGNGWDWDLSNTIGKNDFHYFGDKTYNASSIGNISKTHFDDGGFNFLQNTLNLDFSKSFKSVAQGLNLGLGAEYRYEQYQIYKGEEASYIAYSNTLGQAAGAQGFPGFSPSDVVSANRSNVGLYVDAELNATKKWLLDGAIRFENYSDFGAVSTFKLASRYKVTSNFNLRGSISTGYRAPSLQQINFSNTLTSFSGGQLVQSRIANNNDAVTKSAGIPSLKQETSVNSSIGFSWKAAKNLTFTVDGYMVKVKDRIVLSGLFSAGDPTLPAAFTTALNAINVSTAQFFANAVNTTNYGVDIVADYTKKWGNKSFKVLLAGNIQNMTIDDIHVPTALSSTTLNKKTFFSDREEAFLKASAPNSKFTLNLDYTAGKIGIGTHITAFGTVKLMGYGAATADNPNQTGINPVVPTDANANVFVPEVFNYNSKVVTDIYASYKFCKAASIFIGADNLFNVHPDLGVNQQAKNWAGDNESGGPWDSVQMGFNGLRLFTKLVLNF